MQTLPTEKHPGDLLAHAMACDIMFRHRTGSITGRLNFNIGPGTPVKIGIVGQNIPFYRDGLSSFIYAHVVAVEVVIDGEGRQAYTRYHLSHMRTQKEQDTIKGLMMKEHPVYDSIWQGSSLLDGTFVPTVKTPTGPDWEAT